jgi:hypothetical protein
MTFSELWTVFVQGIFPVSAPLLITSVIFSFICSLFSRHSVRMTLPLILAFGFMGGVAGFSAGLSRVPVVGTVIPAMLTLVSGFLGYLFGKEHLKEWRLVIPFCILIFTFNSLIGLFIGSQMRGKSEDYERQYNEWLLHYEKVDLEADKKEALEEPKNNIDKESK